MGIYYIWPKSFTTVIFAIGIPLAILLVLLVVDYYATFLKYLDRPENKSNYSNLNTFFSYVKNLLTSFGSLILVIILVTGIWRSFIDTTYDVHFKVQIGFDQSRKDRNMVRYLRKLEAGDIQINKLDELTATQLRENYLDKLGKDEVVKLEKLKTIWDTLPDGALKVQQLFGMDFSHISVKVDFGKGTTDLLYPDKNGIIDTTFTISKGANHVIIECFDEGYNYEPARLREVIRSNNELDVGLIALTRRREL